LRNLPIKEKLKGKIETEGLTCGGFLPATSRHTGVRHCGLNGDVGVACYDSVNSLELPLIQSVKTWALIVQESDCGAARPIYRWREARLQHAPTASLGILHIDKIPADRKMLASTLLHQWSFHRLGKSRHGSRQLRRAIGEQRDQYINAEKETAVFGHS